MGLAPRCRGIVDGCYEAGSGRAPPTPALLGEALPEVGSGPGCTAWERPAVASEQDVLLLHPPATFHSNSQVAGSSAASAQLTHRPHPPQCAGAWRRLLGRCLGFDPAAPAPLHPPRVLLVDRHYESGTWADSRWGVGCTRAHVCVGWWWSGRGAGWACYGRCAILGVPGASPCCSERCSRSAARGRMCACQQETAADLPMYNSFTSPVN